jgi:hypothetical protein
MGDYMKVKTKFIGVFVILSLMLISMPPALGQTDYNLGYVDPEDDVTVDIEGSPSFDYNIENFDIVLVESYKLPLKQDIIMELTVLGEIKDAETIWYGFTILDDEEMVYDVMYYNGNCAGYHHITNDGTDDTLEASIENTDTLVVTVPIKNLGYISNYDFYGQVFALFSDETNYVHFEDYAPDQDWDWNGYDDYYEKMIYIIEPLNRSTVFGLYEMNGILNYDEVDIESVEVQIDSQSSGGWELAAISEDGYSWGYNWDTTDLSDGSHTIYSRGYDGEEYYYDEIVVQIDQSCATEPPTMEHMKLNIGDKFEYRETDFEGYYVSSSGSMTLEVEDIEDITVNNQVHEVYKLAMTSEYEMDDGEYHSKSTSTGTIWMRTSDFAFAKIDVYGYHTDTDPDSGTSQSSSHSIITNDPPDRPIQFPVSVGARWEVELEETYDSTYTFDGETDSDNTVDSKITKIECLTTETVTVPAGTFDTFLINFRDIYEESYDEYPDDFENYNDTDGDEWPDDIEEDFGTDPNNPEDYPDFGDGGDGGDGGNGVIVSEEISSSESYFDYYTIEYYSPDLGFFVKIENYDENRQLMSVMELTTYTPGINDTATSSGVSSSESSYSFEIQSVVLFVALLIIVLVIIAALLIRREHKKDYTRFEVEPLEDGSDEVYFSDQDQMGPETPPRSV